MDSYADAEYNTIGNPDEQTTEESLMRKKLGWTAKGIVGMIFTPVGLVFAVLAVVLWRSDTAWKHPEDPVVFLSVFGGIGGMFLIIGLALLGADIRRRIRLRRAYDGGNCVDAEIIGVRSRNNVNMNGSHPCVVECAHTDASGVVHVYHSRYLYRDVTQFLTSKTVPVYIDRFDDNIGFVDIDAVLPEIRVHP